MARIQEFFESRLDLGPSAAVQFLNAWVDTRAGLNQELMKAEMKGGADPAKLAASEAKLREAVGKMARQKVLYEQAVATGNSDLAREAMRVFGQVATTAMKETGATTRAQLGADVDIWELTAEVNRDLATRSEVKNPAVKAVLDGSYKRVSDDDRTTGAAMVPAIARMVDSQLAGEGLLGKVGTDPAATAMVTRAVAAAVAGGDPEAAQGIAENYGAAKGQPWAAFVQQAHRGLTPEDVQAMMDYKERYTSGGRSDVVWEAYERLGGAGLGSAAMKVGGTVAGTPGGMDKAIADTEAAADDLADARKAAMMEGTRAFRPRSNWMITNPNQYTDPRKLSRLRMWGGLDAPYVEEVSGELQAQRGNVWKARERIGERGGLSIETMPEYDPRLFTDLVIPDDGENLARSLESGATVAGDGGWSYTVKADNTITITAAPAGNRGAVGKVLKRGDKGYEAIAAEVAPRLFAGAGPVFNPAVARAEAGDFTGAATAAREVKREDHVAMIGNALVKAGRGEGPVPTGLPASLQERVDALSKMKPLRRDTGMERLGWAVLGSDEPRRREKAEDAVEAREVKARRVSDAAPIATSYEAGKAAADEMAHALGATAPDVGWLRAKLNEQGSAFDATRSEYERGIVEGINEAVEKAMIPARVDPQPLGAERTMEAARPTRGQPLSVGAVSAPDVSEEPYREQTELDYWTPEKVAERAEQAARPEQRGFDYLSERVRARAVDVALEAAPLTETIMTPVPLSIAETPDIETEAFLKFLAEGKK